MVVSTSDAGDGRPQRTRQTQAATVADASPPCQTGSVTTMVLDEGAVLEASYFVPAGRRPRRSLSDSTVSTSGVEHTGQTGVWPSST